MRNAGLTVRHERISLQIKKPFRVIQISDVHFSKMTSHEDNLRKTVEIIRAAMQFGKPGMIAVTGDLISRCPGAYGVRDAVTLMKKLRRIAPVAFSLGNHETDLPMGQQDALLTLLRNAGVTVLHNQTRHIAGIAVTGLTLPCDVYKKDGSYSGLTQITKQLVTECVGTCTAHPQLLLAHSPIGFPAYAEWGADAVLSGHVHGGIVRVGKTGLLSPERRFFPKYTKGLYRLSGSVMNVSAGIGKLRCNNPAEVVCITFVPEEG